jgi:hypothetical protein
LPVTKPVSNKKKGSQDGTIIKAAKAIGRAVGRLAKLAGIATAVAPVPKGKRPRRKYRTKQSTANGKNVSSREKLKPCHPVAASRKS